MALLGFLKKNKTTNFRGKDIPYEVEDSDKFLHVMVGSDWKLRNDWNEPILLKLTLNKSSNVITFFVVKNSAGINDSKAIYNSGGGTVYADLYSLTAAEIKQFTDLLNENKE